MKVRVLVENNSVNGSMSLTSSSPAHGLAAVEAEIRRACKEARRERTSVNLIAVSKTFEADAIQPVIDAGQRVFG